jgi:hypothetical protein
MLTQQRVRRLFTLDEQSGVFRWKTKPEITSPIRIGDIAGHKDATGYWRIRFDYRAYLRSRLVFLYVYGFLPRFVDHRDGDPLNDRPENLRAATPKGLPNYYLTIIDRLEERMAKLEVHVQDLEKTLRNVGRNANPAGVRIPLSGEHCEAAVAANSINLH